MITNGQDSNESDSTKITSVSVQSMPDRTAYTIGEIFSPDGTAQNCVKSILDGVEKLKSYCDTLVIVSNEIFSDGGSYPLETENYLQKLAELHEKIARDADAVYESVCGILLPIKEVKTR